MYTNNKSQHALLYQTLPANSHLRTFGCCCFLFLKHDTPHKLAPRSHLCVFLDYPPNYKGYKSLNLQRNKIIIFIHVAFYEDTFPFQHNGPSPPISQSIHQPSSPFLVIPTSYLHFTIQDLFLELVVLSIITWENLNSLLHTASLKAPNTNQILIRALETTPNFGPCSLNSTFDRAY